MKKTSHGCTSATTPQTSSDKFSKSKRDERIGQVAENRQGLRLKIVEYRNNRDMDVLVVETGEIIKGVRYDYFRQGKVYADLTNYCKPMRHRVYKGAGLFLFILLTVAFVVTRCCAG